MKLENRDQLVEFLMHEWDYVPKQAPETAEKLLNLDPDIRIAFEIWLEKGEFPDTPVHSSLSPKSLNQIVRIKPPAVFLLLDWIRRDPIEAMRAIQEELIGKR